MYHIIPLSCKGKYIVSFKILQKLLKTIHEWSIIMSHHFTVPLWVDIYYFCIFKLQIILLETCFHINLCVWDVERELEVSFGFAWEVHVRGRSSSPSRFFRLCYS